MKSKRVRFALCAAIATLALAALGVHTVIFITGIGVGLWLRKPR